MVGPSCWEGTLVLDLGNSWSETWYYHRFLLCHQFEILYLVRYSGYLSSMLLLSQVLVSLQYRVGPLGFLCLPDDQIGGNVGLMDQVEREN